MSSVSLLRVVSKTVGGGTPQRDIPEYWNGPIPWATVKDFKDGSHKLLSTKEFITEKGLKFSAANCVDRGTPIVCTRMAVGRIAITEVAVAINQDLRALMLRDDYDCQYVVYAMDAIRNKIENVSIGSTVKGIRIEQLLGFEILDVPKPEQTKIAEVLSTVDRAIEQTEALIAKQQRIKAGLMQDLLTRGIDEQGNLRSEETHTFKESPLGRIPVEWGVKELGELVTSAVDGPFGSNLKTEHYVAEPGVRVVRLQNVGNGEFFDTDKAWISREHARRLARHSVESGDVLVGSLGDDKRLFGRACIYPDKPEPAIVKADVFRIRFKKEAIVYRFAVRLFNLPRWRCGLFGLAQGVTRDRVNLTNLMLLKLPVPKKEEQQQVMVDPIFRTTG